METVNTNTNESAIRRFEEAWSSGRPESIDSMVGSPLDSHYLPTLLELIPIEMEFVWKSYRTPQDARRIQSKHKVEDYVDRYPQVDQPRSVRRLLSQEYQLRHRFGDRPSIDEYLDRFPKLNLTRDDLESGLDPAHNQFPVLPGYEIIDVLGRGGMAVVYRAEQRSLRRQVAVKMLHPSPFFSGEVLDRFCNEADSVAQLNHENVLKVFEFSQAGGVHFISLELAEGGSLADMIQGTPQPQKWAAEICILMANAIQAAHDRGIVHRDLKPSNVLLTSEGTPKISDFGLAKLLDSDSSHTRTGQILGTPSYMSPEQAKGDTTRIGRACDVYALGAVLYELLTGRPPFRGESVWDTVSQVLNGTLVPPSELQPRIDRDLETICLKCLAKLPEKRYLSAREIAEDLTRYLNNEPIRARPVGRLERAARLCARNKVLAATIASSILVVVLVACVGFYHVLKERNRFREQRDIAQSNLYKSLLSDANSQMASRSTGWLWTAMNKIHSASMLEIPDRDPVELRELLIECMGTEHPCFRIESVLEGHSGAVMAVAVAPNGQHYATVSADSTLRIWNDESQSVVAVLNNAAPFTDLEFRPDGKELVVLDSSGIVRLFGESLWEAAQTHSRTVTVSAPCSAVTYSSDGSMLILGLEDGRIELFPLSEGDQGRSVLAHNGPVRRIVRGIEPALIASYSTDRTVKVWTFPALDEHSVLAANRPDGMALFGPNLVWGERLSFGYKYQSLLNKTDAVFRPQLHQASISSLSTMHYRKLLTSSEDGTMKLWNTNSFTMIASAEAELPAIYDAAFGPGFHWIIAGYQDGTVRKWELSQPVERDLSPRNSWLSHDVVFIPRTRNLLAGTIASPQAGTFITGIVEYDKEVSQKREVRLNVWEQGGHTDQIWGVCVSSNGQFAATASHDQTVRVWDLASRELKVSLNNEDGINWSVAFSPDCRFVLSGTNDIKVWDVETGLIVHEFRGHSQLVTGIEFVGENRFVSSSLDGTIRMWNLATKQSRGIVMSGSFRINQIAVDERRNRIAVALSNHYVQVLDLSRVLASQDGFSALKSSEIEEFQSHSGPVWSVAYSPDGRHLASGSQNGLIVLHDAETLDYIVRFKGGTGEIRNMSFSDDCNLLAAAAYAAPTIVWDLDAVQARLKNSNLAWPDRAP